MELLKNLEGMSADEQMSAVVELQKAAMKNLEEQKQVSIGKSAEMVIQGLKKIKADFEAKFDSLNYDIQTKVSNLKDGQQGLQGQKGEQGERGLDGAQGRDGKSGLDGKNGLDGKDGISVQDAKIDFDGSLVITLSDGREINVGEVVPVDVAQTIHKIQSGSGGDSQTTLNAIAALQATIATYGTMALQNANAVAITGGTINGTTIGATTPATGKFSTLESTGTASLGTTSAQYIQAVGNATEPQILAVGSGTNIPLVLQPKGTGALQAQATTSSAVGGNVRGANAVDWQTSRSSANQVSSGTGTTLSGGVQNIASNAYTTVGGGVSNGASGFAGVVSGGWNNYATGNLSVVSGGYLNTASGTYAFIGSGQLNTSAGYYNFIGGGFTNSGTSASAVTTQSGTMNGTTAVTLSGSNANIKVGQYISGTSIAGDTYVAAISGTSLTLSKVASGSSTSTLSFFTPHGVVVGGGNNQATGSYSFIGGGGDAGTAANRNVASGAWSTVVGGARHTASGNGAFVGGGGTDGSGSYFGNTASGDTSVIVGGSNHSASGTGSMILGGFGNQAIGSYSSVFGGTGNLASATQSSATGNNATTRSIIGQLSIAPCNSPISGNSGVSQTALLALGVQTTDATATVLRSNTSAASTTNQVILPNNSAYAFKGTVIANVTGAANGASWSFEGAIMRGANAASTVLIETPAINPVAAKAGATAWLIALTADTTNGGLAVTVTGAASTTIRWVCKAETTETTF